MVGKNILIKCPHCGKLIYTDIGMIDYYDYDGHKVVVMDCPTCEREFITTTRDFDFAFDKYAPVGIVRDVFWFVMDNITKIRPMNEDEAVDFVLNHFEETEECSHLSPRDLTEFKSCIQYVLAKLTEPTGNQSWELTDEVKAQLKYSTTIC